MGITERRQREKEALSQKIIDAAREIFIKEGYSAVTMRRIADKIEYSATAIYSHFKDKDSLLRAITAADFRALTTMLHELGNVTDPIEKLRLMAHAYVEFGVTHPNQYRLIFMTRQPHYSTRVAEELHGDPEQDPYAWVILVLKEALREGNLKFPEQDLDVMAQTLWSAFHGLVSLHISLGEEPWVEWAPVKQRVDVMFKMLLAGVLASQR
ncbi:TetR/AcrR family transcriptional regulator [Chitinivorax sp. B]|uniref:TetR/AcrR family transcriptional regulator n=1 Tax=Chitinivorax sp. B TaxID=2502235 RepID=UPI001485B324|nr:TetR/AcrR family transcriptional regulator [Chitinivorax sp. B]